MTQADFHDFAIVHYKYKVITTPKSITASELVANFKVLARPFLRAKCHLESFKAKHCFDFIQLLSKTLVLSCRYHCRPSLVRNLVLAIADLETYS